MAQDYSEAAALRAAKEVVSRLESQNPGDINKVLGKLTDMQSKNPISKIPSPDEIFKQRISELAHAYAHVSDGRGGIDRASGRLALERFENALDGKTVSGRGFLPSQQLAIHTGKFGQLTEAVTEFAQKNLSKLGIGGKAVGFFSGVVFAAGASAGEASPSQLIEAGVNGAVPGLGTLSIGEGSGSNRLCKIFGDVVVPGAVGVGTSLVASPIAGLAAGTAASVALSDPATASCNRVVQKLGF